MLCWTLVDWWRSSYYKSRWIQGSKLFLQKKNRGYGGVLIFVAFSSDFVPLAKVNKLSLEQTCEISAIFIPIYNLIIVNAYHSPSANLEHFLEILDMAINQIDFATNVVICDDFNVICNLNENIRLA